MSNPLLQKLRETLTAIERQLRFMDQVRRADAPIQPVVVLQILERRRRAIERAGGAASRAAQALEQADPAPGDAEEVADLLRYWHALERDLAAAGLDVSEAADPEDFDGDPLGLGQILGDFLPALDGLLASSQASHADDDFQEIEDLLASGAIEEAERALRVLRDQRMDDPRTIAMLALARVQNEAVALEERVADAQGLVRLARALDFGDARVEETLARVEAILEASPEAQV